MTVQPEQRRRLTRRWIAILGVLLIVVVSIGVGWRVEHSVAHLRSSALPETPPPSELGGPPQGTEAKTVASAINVKSSDVSSSWKVSSLGGATILSDNRNGVLANCLDASPSGVAVLSGSSTNEAEPKVYASESFSAPGGLIVFSRVVQLASASTERSDLARYSTRALSPCLSRWMTGPLSHYAQAPIYVAFEAPRISGAQAIGFHYRYQIGGGGSETFQFYGDMVLVGSGRLEGAVFFQSGYLMGAGSGERWTASKEQQLTYAFITRMAALGH